MAAWHIASGEEMLLRCRGRQSLERGLKYAQTAAPAVATIETGIQYDYDCMRRRDRLQRVMEVVKYLKLYATVVLPFKLL